MCFYRERGGGVGGLIHGVHKAVYKATAAAAAADDDGDDDDDGDGVPPQTHSALHT